MLQLNVLMPDKRIRVLVSAGFGSFAGLFCWFLMHRFNQGAADFSWAIRAASDLLAQRNPYSTPGQLYPLPAAFFGLPFISTRPEIAAGIFYGLSTALLAFGITRHGFHRMLIFLAFPYWAGMLAVQWIPLIMATEFFWWLMPVAVAKPHIGLPVAVTRSGRNGAIACAAIVALSFLLMPHWFTLWLAQTKNYVRFVPLLVLPGPLLAAALVRYRDRDAWLLFLGACMPQRWFYDPFFLWLIPKTRRQIVFTVGFSWLPAFWRWYHTPHQITEVGRIIVLCLYLPMLVIVLLPKTRGTPQNREALWRIDSGAKAEVSGTGTKD